MESKQKNSFFRRAAARTFGAGIPAQAEIEQFGADGEEVICRILCEQFDTVYRNAVVPHGDKYLEKDFLVVQNGVPFVLEIKNWKGTIGQEGDSFYQDKENGVHKVLKSPVGTTEQFIRVMKEFYGIRRQVYGIVVFAEPDCVLRLPEEVRGILLIPAGELVSRIHSLAKKDAKGQEPFDFSRVLRCTRFYTDEREFCKGIVIEDEIVCVGEDGREVRLDTDEVRYLSVVRQPFRLRDKLYVTFSDGSSAVFYNRDTVLSIACLDGTFRKIAVNKVRHIVF